MRRSTLILALALAIPAAAQTPPITVFTDTYRMVDTGGVLAVERVDNATPGAVGVVDVYGPTCIERWLSVTTTFDATGTPTFSQELLNNGSMSVTVTKPTPPAITQGVWLFLGYSVEWDNDPSQLAMYATEQELTDALAAAWANTVCRTIRVRALFLRSYHRPEVPRWDPFVHVSEVKVSYGFRTGPG